MRLTEFCRECREMVQTRWVACFGSHNSIRLILVTDQFTEEYHRSLSPILAVATDRFGSIISGSTNIRDAATILDLKLKIATLIHTAASSDMISVEPAKSVREELLEALNTPNIILQTLRDK